MSRTDVNNKTESYSKTATSSQKTERVISDGLIYTITSSGNSWSSTFDTRGLRVWGYNGTAATKYCYDITAGIPAMIAEGPNDGSEAYYYVREPGDVLVMRKNGTDLKYNHFNELGCTLFLTDAYGIQTEKYVFNAWGKVMSSRRTVKRGKCRPRPSCRHGITNRICAAIETCKLS